MNFEEACAQVDLWKKKGLKVVLATGVFDILHIEHMRFLRQARQAGDRLIVGLESDRRVKKIKGSSRPIHTQILRLEQLQMLKPVDYAFVLPESFSSQEDWEAFMDHMRPDVYAVSSHSDWLENKRNITEKFGGKLQIVHQFNPEISTSQIYTKLFTED